MYVITIFLLVIGLYMNKQNCDFLKKNEIETGYVANICQMFLICLNAFFLQSGGAL